MFNGAFFTAKLNIACVHAWALELTGVSYRSVGDSVLYCNTSVVSSWEAQPHDNRAAISAQR